MTLNNAYKIYKWLIDRYNTGSRFLTMGEAVTEAAHAFLQRGEPMRKQKAKGMSSTATIQRRVQWSTAT